MSIATIFGLQYDFAPISFRKFFLFPISAFGGVRLTQNQNSAARISLSPAARPIACSSILSFSGKYVRQMCRPLLSRNFWLILMSVPLPAFWWRRWRGPSPTYRSRKGISLYAILYQYALYEYLPGRLTVLN